MKTKFKHFDIIEKVFGKDTILKKKSLIDFPFIYSNNFELFDVYCYFDFVLVVPIDESIPSDLLKGVYGFCQNNLNKRAVLFSYNSSKSVKHFFEETHINFVSIDGDCRLFENDKLFNLLDLSNESFKERYTKTTQLVVNFYLSNPIKEYSTREIANQFDFSFSSVSRANAFLHEISSIDKRGTGNKAKYIIRSKKEFFGKVKPYFINPIKNRKMVYLNQEELDNCNGLFSGENALSFYTNLESSNVFIELVFDKAGFEKQIANSLKRKTDENICYIEEFIYNPSYFSFGKTISPLDAYIIASKRYLGNNDSRISSEIKALERSIVNGEYTKH